MFNLIYLRLIFSLIMTNLYLQLSLVVFLLNFLNFIDQNIPAASTGCCFTGLVRNSCLWTALLFMWVTLGGWGSRLIKSVSPCKIKLRRGNIEGIFSRWKLWLQSQDNLTRCICSTLNNRRVFWIVCYNVGGTLQRIFLLYRCLLNVKTLL